MNKWTLKSLVAAAVGVLTLAGQANAAVSYSYVTDAHAGQGPANIQLNVGETRSVKLYLLETLTGGSASIINSSGGMAGVGLRIQRTAGAPAGSSSLGALTYNTTDFSGPRSPSQGTAQQPDLFAFTETGPIDPTDPTTPPPVTGNAGNNAANARPNAVYLGSIQLIAGNAGSTTTFNLLPFDPTAVNGSGDTITSTPQYDLDRAASAGGAPSYTGTSANLSTLTVSVVPEPTFAGVAMVLGAAGSMIRRRRQQA